MNRYISFQLLAAESSEPKNRGFSKLLG